jgi:regulator of protease activity HflC (stomatin/prohibitin superfamily)
MPRVFHEGAASARHETLIHPHDTWSKRMPEVAGHPSQAIGGHMSHLVLGLQRAGRRLRSPRVIALAVLALAIYAVYTHPPVETIGPQEVGVRLNRWSGSSTTLGEGLALVIPGLHELRRFGLEDHMYRPQRSSTSDGEAPLQSSEGLSIGAELNIRYALDPQRLDTLGRKLPNDIDGELVGPLLQGVIYRAFTHYTVREIFSSKRQELQDTIEAELRPLMAKDGLILKQVMMGNIDLPADYRAGMDQLLAVELETEKMKYTLELTEKQVKETELQGEAEKVKRQKAAEAAASEQVIAAQAQEEAMKHVIPFKQKQIEQRKLEADADKVSRVLIAEGAAQARLIEAKAEAESRQQLAKAEVYRMDEIGKISSIQLERDGALISKYPLLIQKTLADKLSDKISVIIAAPPANGGFIGSNLLGQAASASGAAQ